MHETWFSSRSVAKAKERKGARFFEVLLQSTSPGVDMTSILITFFKKLDAPEVNKRGRGEVLGAIVVVAFLCENDNKRQSIICRRENDRTRRSVMCSHLFCLASVK